MKKSTKQKARRKDGAKDVQASLAPWVIKYRPDIYNPWFMVKEAA